MSAEEKSVSAADALEAGKEHHQAGRLAEAEQLYRSVLDGDPDNADAMHLLGVIAGQRGQFEVAADMIGRAIGVQPTNAAFLFNLGNALKDAGRLAQAEQAYRSALAHRPDYADAYANLGLVLQALRRPQEAIEGYRRALALKPVFPQALNNLGNALLELGRSGESEECYRQALAQQPGYADAQLNLGQALRAQGRLPEAESCFRETLRLRPAHSPAHNYLANILRGLGRLEEAERSYRQALALDPGDAEAHSNLMFLLNYLPDKRPEDIFAEHRAFARRFCPAPAPARYLNGPEPERRLRIGYVSADLRDHALAFFIEPVLANHDRGTIEVYCYYNYGRGDAVTDRLKTLADHWRTVAALNDESLAALIRTDRIDILIDLSGHTGHSRLLAFGRKPAPVQATWLGYLNTTGLEAIDYRITDARATPPGPLDTLHCERLVRLPDSQWCYRPPVASPEPSAPPSATSDRITFASFTNPAKIGEPMLGIWGRLLARVPQSRLLVAGATLVSIPDDFVERFTRHGIARERLELLGAKPFPEYLAMHRSADIILDTHPYSGGTTTCHALWMGVPVVTLAGETATSRGGASLLRAAGLDELVADSAEHYLDIAAALAADPGRLAVLRSGMRQRLLDSPLMDEARFTRNLEDAYRAMWRTWCRQHA